LPVRRPKGPLFPVTFRGAAAILGGQVWGRIRLPRLTRSGKP
jgi:hypothetical protein